MPTGSGKSLCYQLPGVMHENKITIVFSPLIALIKDQMDHLTKLKICAESLNSKMTQKERERVIYDLRSIKPNTKFLYITPEQAATDFFRGLLDSIVKYNKLALVAVDEVCRTQFQSFYDSASLFFDFQFHFLHYKFNFQIFQFFFLIVSLCIRNGPRFP